MHGVFMHSAVCRTHISAVVALLMNFFLVWSEQ